MRSRRSAIGPVAVAGLVLLAVWSRFATLEAEVDVGFVGNTASRPQVRSLKTSLGPVDKAMKDRINSVKKTGKLTDAMRLVAAAKVRRAQDGVAKARPFSNELQSMIKGLVKKLKGSGLESELPMLRVPEKVNEVGILLVTANRGLCGAYNTFVIKKCKARVEALNAQGIVPKLIIVGKKGRNALNTRLKDVKLNYTEIFFDSPNTITAKVSTEVAEAVKNIFLSGEVDKVEVIYAKFINLITNTPMVKTLLPLSPTGIEDPEDETFTLTSEDGKLKAEKQKVPPAKAKNIENDVIFDQPPEVILNSMLPLYLNSQILSILFDASASELGSRMTAMKAATDNAGELEKALTLVFNKKRQAAITAEISEISAGAMALGESDKGPAGPKLGISDNEDTVSSDFMKELADGSIPEFPQEFEGPRDRAELAMMKD